MSVYSSTELVLYTLKFLRFQGMLANKQQMLLYLCHDRVLLHACGRRGVASTLSTRKGTHFFADMQEKAYFSAIFQSDNGSRRHISRVSVSIRARRWDIISPCPTGRNPNYLNQEYLFQFGQFRFLISLRSNDYFASAASRRLYSAFPCQSVRIRGTLYLLALRARNPNYLNLFP